MKPTREFRLPTRAIAASIITDSGCVRESNEDNGRHISSFPSANGIDRGTLTIVADGMGGHSSGEVASEMAVDMIGRYYYANETSSAADALSDAIQMASAEIYSAAVEDIALIGMGTTVVALAIQDGVGHAAHVGDSRLYRLRGREMERMTIDHSQVMEMVQRGLISFEEAQNHEDKNIILRAVGTQPTVEVEVSDPFEVWPGDQFLLCSDGLCDMADDNDILRVWLAGTDIHNTAERLVSLAKERGGEDNITVGIVSVSDQENIIERAVPETREIEVLR